MLASFSLLSPSLPNYFLSCHSLVALPAPSLMKPPFFFYPSLDLCLSPAGSFLLKGSFNRGFNFKLISPFGALFVLDLKGFVCEDYIVDDLSDEVIVLNGGQVGDVGDFFWDGGRDRETFERGV